MPKHLQQQSQKPGAPAANASPPSILRVESPPNKWQKQFFQDIQQLEFFDGTYWVVDLISPSLHELVENEDIRQAFVNFDVKELAQREICYKINIDDIDDQAIRQQDEEVEYVCDMIHNEGGECGATYSSKQALLMHQRSAGKHLAEHVTLSLIHI